MVICGRNDNYMGNFLYRVTTAINYLARNVERAGRADAVELLVADWNSEVPLSSALELTPAARSITRYVCTPPSLAVAKQQPDQNFHHALAYNSALRRAGGRFVMLSDADALIPLHSIRSLFALLEGKSFLPVNLEETFFIANRRHVPWEVVQREPTLDQWDEYLLTRGGDLPVDPGSPGMGICQIGWLAHREIWHACRGMNEQMHYWGWTDAELMLRISQKYDSVQLAGVGVSIYHMEHWPRNQRGEHARTNPQTPPNAFAANGEGWGLGDCPTGVTLVAPGLVSPNPRTGSSASMPRLGGEGTDATTNSQSLDRVQRAARTAGQASSAAVFDAARLLERRKDREVREIVKKAWKRFPGWRTERKALELLAALSLNRHPRVYVECGASSGARSLFVVAGSNPSLDIYAIDDWTSEERSTNSPDEVADALKQARFRGYVRYVTGDTRTALQRLLRSLRGPLLVDLALFRQCRATGCGIDLLLELIPRLSSTGVLVCLSEEPGFRDSFSGAMQSDFGHLTLLEVDRVTSVIVPSQALAKPRGNGEPTLPAIPRHGAKVRLFRFLTGGG